jgi:hypothetical protein
VEQQAYCLIDEQIVLPTEAKERVIYGVARLWFKEIILALGHKDLADVFYPRNQEELVHSGLYMYSKFL